MFHCFHERTKPRGLALSGRLKCQVTRLTSVKFIAGFVEREWRWVLMAQKCHSYAIYARTVLFQRAREMWLCGDEDWTHKLKDPIWAAAALICLKCLRGDGEQKCLLYIYMHDSLFCVCVCAVVAASGQFSVIAFRHYSIVFAPDELSNVYMAEIELHNVCFS